MHQARLLTAVLVLSAGPSLAQLEPLSSDTLPPSPRTVVTPGYYALSIDGDLDLGGFVFRGGYPFLHGNGTANTALGRDALISSTPGDPFPNAGLRNTALGDQTLRANTTGYRNTASGVYALYSNTSGAFNTAHGNATLFGNTTGWNNTAVGNYALLDNTTGNLNTSVGSFALRTNTTGYTNTAIGAAALRHNTTGKLNTAVGASAAYYNSLGIQNTAVGFNALNYNTTGSYNVALGSAAGTSNETGSSNIWISSDGGDESNTLRVGDGTGTASRQLNRAFISGIRNATGAFDQDVCVNSSTDQLGPCSASSARFKEDIADLEKDSEALFALRPVRFRYSEEFAGESEERPIQYGLIAEEVAEIYPQLVTYDAEGKPMTVRYEALTPLLLNELKKQRAELEMERTRNASRDAELAGLRADRARLDQLSARLARLEARETSRESPAGVALR